MSIHYANQVLFQSNKLDVIDIKIVTRTALPSGSFLIVSKTAPGRENTKSCIVSLSALKSNIDGEKALGRNFNDFFG